MYWYDHGIVCLYACGAFDPVIGNEYMDLLFGAILLVVLVWSDSRKKNNKINKYRLKL